MNGQQTVPASHIMMERVQNEYFTIVNSTPAYSLQELFNSERVQLETFCQDFIPYHDGNGLRNVAEKFGEEHGIWLKNTKHYINCAFFLYPDSLPDRMLTLLKNLVIGFYLNDTMGRDMFKFLDHQDQQNAARLIRKMSLVEESLQAGSGLQKIELANLINLHEFKENSPVEWFRRFLRLYCRHIDITHRNGNTDTMDHLPDITEYIDTRCFYAGVHHVIMWIEYSTGDFLDWELIRRTAVSSRLERLHWVTAAFASLANDLFSFEGEVIDNKSDSNLVMILKLNNAALSLKEAILRAAEIIRNLLREIMDLLTSINSEVQTMKFYYPELSDTLSKHLNGVIKCVQAIWKWHVHTIRYKRASSIWYETKLL